MKVSTQQHAALVTVLFFTAVIAFALLWALGQSREASRNLSAVTALARSLSQLRLLSFEFALRPETRVTEQLRLVMLRVNEQLTEPTITEHFKTMLNEMQRRQEQDWQVFEELQQLASHQVELRQLLVGQMLIRQQDSLAASYQMIDASTAHIGEVQRMTFMISLLGLAIIAIVKTAFSAILHFKITLPIQQLQITARRAATGHLTDTFHMEGTDEVSLLSKDLERMSIAQRGLLNEQKSSIKQLAALNHELESFSYSVAHDLRGPLRSMDGFALCLIEDYGAQLDADGLDALQRIRNASQRMGLLIDDMLALSQITRTKLSRTQVDLSAMAKEIAKDMDSENTATHVTWRIAEGLVVDGDRQLLRHAMVNLMSNAFKFSSKVSTPTIEITTRERDGISWIMVKDNGVGFDMQFVDQLFGVFKRLHQAQDYPGTGVGLAIVQRVMHRHGGEVFAQSVVGEGAEFHFHTGEV